MSMLPDTLKALSIKVSQYFLDFLESDFKRQKAPRRRVVLQTESGFKAGMSLLSYPYSSGRRLAPFAKIDAG